MFDLARGLAALQPRSAHRHTRLPFLVAGLCFGLAAGAAAQGHGGGGRPSGGGRGPGFPGAGGPGPNGGGPAPDANAGNGGNGAANRGAMQHGPAGRWWDDTRYAHNVGLTGDQQRRMDGVFQENRATLVSGLDTLRRAEARLSTLSASDHPSESALNAEIQNVAQARADLEKANTHMVLQLRNEMTQEQINRMAKLK